MMQLTWLFIAAIATIATAGAFLVETSEHGDIGVAGGVIGFIAWTLWAYGAVNVQIPDASGGQPIEMQYPALALFGAALAVFALGTTIDHVMSLLDPDESEDLVRDWGREQDGRRY